VYSYQVAYSDVVEAVKDADILLFILPHQFVERACNTIKSHVKKTAFAVSFSKVCLFRIL
jgi:glycerol-3-phosphate dehydrogenase (NAD+)